MNLIFILELERWCTRGKNLQKYRDFIICENIEREIVWSVRGVVRTFGDTGASVPHVCDDAPVLIQRQYSFFIYTITIFRHSKIK